MCLKSPVQQGSLWVNTAVRKRHIASVDSTCICSYIPERACEQRERNSTRTCHCGPKMPPAVSATKDVATEPSATPTVHLRGLGMGKTGFSPRPSVQGHFKGKVSVSPDSGIFRTQESTKFSHPEKSSSLYLSTLMFRVPGLCCNPAYTPASPHPFRATLRIV